MYRVGCIGRVNVYLFHVYLFDCGCFYMRKTGYSVERRTLGGRIAGFIDIMFIFVCIMFKKWKTAAAEVGLGASRAGKNDFPGLADVRVSPG